MAELLRARDQRGLLHKSDVEVEFISLSLSLVATVPLIADQPPRALRRCCWIPVIRVNGLPSARRRSGLVCGVGARWTEEGEVNSAEEDVDIDGEKAKNSERKSGEVKYLKCWFYSWPVWRPMGDRVL